MSGDLRLVEYSGCRTYTDSPIQVTVLRHGENSVVPRRAADRYAEQNQALNSAGTLRMLGGENLNKTHACGLRRRRPPMALSIFVQTYLESISASLLH